MKKVCAECHHFNGGRYGDWCTNPRNGINLVNGLTKNSWAASCRSDQTKCGVFGKWFEPKITKPSLLEKLRAWVASKF